MEREPVESPLRHHLRSFHKRSMGDVGCSTFALTLAEPSVIGGTPLTYLGLAKNDIGVHGVNALCAALRSPGSRLQRLKKIEVYCNPPVTAWFSKFFEACLEFLGELEVCPFVLEPQLSLQFFWLQPLAVVHPAPPIGSFHLVSQGNTKHSLTSKLQNWTPFCTLVITMQPGCWRNVMLWCTVVLLFLG